MKYLLSIFFLLYGIASFAQSAENKLLGKWKAYKLEHFDSKDNLDQEASDHFWNMLEGRTLNFNADGTVDISGYNACYWELKKKHLSMRYSATAPWEKDLILLLNKKVLSIRSSIDIGDGSDYQVLEYHRVEK